MNKTLAHIVSYAFHPLLVPSYLIIILMYLFGNTLITINPEVRSHILIVVFLMTFIIPVVSAITLYKSHIISSVQMEEKEDRKYPFIFTSCIYLVISYFFFIYFKGSYIFIIMLLMTTGVLLTTGISFFWKISAHAIGIGGFVGFFYFFIHKSMEQDMLLPFLLAIMVSGLVLSSRMALKSHNLLEIGAGFVLGLLNSFIIFLLI